jgi:di/tricarboxylate transporter
LFYLSPLSPEPLLMMVAVSASTACLTPIATPTNLMVFSPGGYRFGGRERVDLPLMALILIASLLLVPLIWPLTV